MAVEESLKNSIGIDKEMLLTVTTIIGEAIVVGKKAHAIIARDKFRVLLNKV